MITASEARRVRWCANPFQLPKHRRKRGLRCITLAYLAKHQCIQNILIPGDRVCASCRKTVTEKSPLADRPPRRVNRRAVPCSVESQADLESDEPVSLASRTRSALRKESSNRNQGDQKAMLVGNLRTPNDEEFPKNALNCDAIASRSGEPSMHAVDGTNEASVDDLRKRTGVKVEVERDLMQNSEVKAETQYIGETQDAGGNVAYLKFEVEGETLEDAELEEDPAAVASNSHQTGTPELSEEPLVGDAQTDGSLKVEPSDRTSFPGVMLPCGVSAADIHAIYTGSSLTGGLQPGIVALPGVFGPPLPYWQPPFLPFGHLAPEHFPLAMEQSSSVLDLSVRSQESRSTVAGAHHPGEEVGDRGQELRATEPELGQLHQNVDGIINFSFLPSANGAFQIDKNRVSDRNRSAEQVAASTSDASVDTPAPSGPGKEKPLQCDFCRSSFMRKSNLTKHVLSRHGGEKPHVCNVCARAFKLRRSLARHQREEGHIDPSQEAPPGRNSVSRCNVGVASVTTPSGHNSASSHGIGVPFASTMPGNGSTTINAACPSKTLSTTSPVECHSSDLNHDAGVSSVKMMPVHNCSAGSNVLFSHTQTAVRNPPGGMPCSCPHYHKLLVARDDVLCHMKRELAARDGVYCCGAVFNTGNDLKWHQQLTHGGAVSSGGTGGTETPVLLRTDGGEECGLEGATVSRNERSGEVAQKVLLESVMTEQRMSQHVNNSPSVEVKDSSDRVKDTPPVEVQEGCERVSNVATRAVQESPEQLNNTLIGVVRDGPEQSNNTPTGGTRDSPEQASNKRTREIQGTSAGGGNSSCVATMYTSRHYVCIVCRKVYKSEQRLQQHKEKVHQGRNRCKKCGVRFPNVTSLAVHKETSHCGCLRCPKLASYQTRLRNHEVVAYRGQSKTLKCPLCGKPMSSKKLLNKHIKVVHASQRRFKCRRPGCGKVFTVKMLLTIHESTFHKGIQLPKCELCGKIFLKTAKLAEHINVIHYGLKPYACETCGMTFPQRDAVVRHIRRVHENFRPYLCVLCMKDLSSKQRLIGHLGKMHGKQVTWRTSGPDDLWATLGIDPGAERESRSHGIGSQGLESDGFDFQALGSHDPEPQDFESQDPGMIQDTVDWAWNPAMEPTSNSVLEMSPFLGVVKAEPEFSNHQMQDPYN